MYYTLTFVIHCLLSVLVIVTYTSTTTEGNDITVTCDAMGIGYPPPAIMWSRNDRVLSGNVLVSDSVNVPTGNGNISRASVNLTITNTFRDDTGVYRCFANNSMGNDSSDVRIVVQC